MCRNDHLNDPDNPSTPELSNTAPNAPTHAEVVESIKKMLSQITIKETDRDIFAVDVWRLSPDMPLWTRLADYAEHCSWQAGHHLAEMLRENRFTDWEAVFVALDGDKIIGYCTFLRTDYYPENRYWPWISSIFVDEEARGQGVCGLLIHSAIDYAREQGFQRVYIPSDMIGFYERYGFHKIDELTNYGGDVDNVFARDI